jgi:hypothetical protein
MENELRTREETIEDYCLVYNFCMKRWNVSITSPCLSREEARLELQELEEKDYISYITVESDIREFLRFTDRIQRDLEESRKERSGNVSEIEEERLNFDLTKKMYQRTAKVLGVKTAEEFLRLYFANSPTFTPKNRKERLMHLDYIHGDLPFEDFLIDKKTGRNPFIKVKITEPIYIEGPERFC